MVLEYIAIWKKSLLGNVIALSLFNVKLGIFLQGYLEILFQYHLFHSFFDRILENLPCWYKIKFGEMHLKMSAIFAQSLSLHIWIKQSLSFLIMKFETQGSFLLGDMGIFVTSCSTFRCMVK